MKDGVTDSNSDVRNMTVYELNNFINMKLNCSLIFLGAHSEC